MKSILFSLLVLCSTAHAQSTFRIYDEQMNDVTGSVIYYTDSAASAMQAPLTVENTDMISHQVIAARIVISQPATAENAISWGMMMYVPTVDTAAIPETIASGDSAAFAGDYFPNGTYDTARIMYCFWDQNNPSNYSCVTVQFDNRLANGMGTPAESKSPVWYGPNPAPVHIGVGWYNQEYSVVNLYSSDGKLIDSRDVRGKSECAFDLTRLPNGIYMISCVGDDGKMYNSRFVH